MNTANDADGQAASINLQHNNDTGRQSQSSDKSPPIDPSSRNGKSDSAALQRSPRCDSEPFAALVGGRVRNAREDCGLIRKRLSELSGVSLRYLAQLENGGGNISVALLHKVASALGYPVEWFVRDEDPVQPNLRRPDAYQPDAHRPDAHRPDAHRAGSHQPDAGQIAELYAQASASQQQRVLDILTPPENTAGKKRRICLIGLRGAGKSTIGRNVSKKIALPFMELNTEISALCGMPIHELINFFGQEGYRRLERQALERIVENTSDVMLAAAGGIVVDQDTYQYLLSHFHTVWLKASPEEHMARVREQGDERPMTGNPQAMEQLKSILTNREALYANADITINTSCRSLLQTENEVEQALLEVVY